MPDSAEMARRGRIGGLVTSARHGPEITAPARAAYLERLANEVDPDGALSPHERQRRAKQLQRAHLVRAARKSAIARSRRVMRIEMAETAVSETSAIPAEGSRRVLDDLPKSA